ncbi:MAG: DUF2845 domain-containing protein [Gammaproteobacteria bacterium]|nr:DUF2845 domain-containing protein [Gammaproteobacteria bacterium]
MCLPLSAGAQSLRCGEASIAAGSTQAEVAARCGQPEQINRQTQYSEGGAVLPGRPFPGNGLPPLPAGVTRSGAELSVETGIYNFGPDRLMQSIRFENGVVVKIESLGYGY